VKRKQLIKKLISTGCYLKRSGGRHDIYANPLNGKVSPVPRHNEIKESLIIIIKAQLGI